jgi:hypothetical protein
VNYNVVSLKAKEFAAYLAVSVCTARVIVGASSVG